MTHLDIKNYLYMRGGSVGIKASIDDDVEIRILTKDKEGKLVYPNTYRIKKNKLKFYKIEKFGKGCPVRVVPISDLEIV